MIIVLETFKNALVQGLMLAVLGLGFSWVYRTTGVFHIAYALSILSGAYVAVHSYRLFDCGMVLSVVAGSVIAAIVSLAVSLVYRVLQFKEASGSLKLVTSLGLYYAIVGLVALLIGTDIKTAGIARHDSWNLDGLIITSPDIRYVSVAVAIVCLVAVLHYFTRFGYHMNALAGNRKLYSALGHNEFRLLGAVMLFSGAFAGIFGAFEGLRNGADPFGFLSLTVASAVVAIVGGRNLFRGPVLAGLALGFLQAILTQVLSDRWSDTFVYGLLLVVIAVNPAFANELTRERYEE